MLPIPRSLARRLGFATALAALSVSLASPTSAQIKSTGEWVIGTVDLLELDDPTDVWSSGKMVISGQVIIIPRNLMIDLPANRLTLQQLFADAPPGSVSVGESGLATLDASRGIGAVADVRGNRTHFGNVIAGEIILEKGTETIQGTVTYINHTDGYLRVDGIPGDDTTGLMVRINDPDGRFTIQQGAGCDGGPNCSPDVRFGVDPDNFTIVFATGYPAAIPSTVPVGARSGFTGGDDPSAASDANGLGDPFAPASNRTSNPVLDATRFAPIQMGDAILAGGNFEEIAGQFFLSAHSVTVSAKLFTRDDPTQPDYLVWDEVEWHSGPFDNDRVKLLAIGFATLPSTQVDIFALHVNPDTNENNEFPIGSTVGNPNTINHGIGPGAGGIFKVVYDLDFVDPEINPLGSPCTNLANAGFSPGCTGGIGTLAENFAFLAPVSRELIGRTRRTPPVLPGIITRDINGNEAPHSEYLTPCGIGYPEYGEIDLARLQEPYSFDGLPWLLDRRLSPGGCDGPCEGTAQPLDPFPSSGSNVGANAPVASRIFAHFPFGGGDFVPAAAPAPAFPILATPRPALGPQPGPAAPIADFTASTSVGVAPLTVAFTDASGGGPIGARLWDFGDGTFSTDTNPVHTFGIGTFDVTMTALGAGGQDTVVRTGAVAASDPGGGPGAPTAAFSADVTAGNVPLTVNFTDESTGEVTSWSWNFGDGNTSTAQNPSHTYTVAGLYSVSLTATGSGGSGNVVQANLIAVNEPGGLDVDFVTNEAPTGPAPLRVRFRAINVIGRATSGTFDFGDGTSAAVGANNGRVAHTYQTPGVYTVTLTATDGTNNDIEQKVGFVTVTAPITASGANSTRR